MPGGLMPRRLPRSARLSLAATKLLVVAAIAVAGLLTQPLPSGPGSIGYPANATPWRATCRLDRHDCSPVAFADATPLSAIVRTARGHLRHVSFDTGWEVYASHGAARLVAVCLDEAPGQG